MSTRESRIVLGAYDDESIHPTGNNWTRHSRFKIDCYLQNKTEISIPHTITYWTDIDKLVIDRSGNILMTISDNHLLKSHFGKVIKIDQGGNISELYATNNRLLPPVIGKDQKIYVAEAYSFNNDDLHLYCLDSDGILLWERQFTCKKITSIPVIGQYENIYIVTGKQQENLIVFTLHALTMQGDEKWNWSHIGYNLGEPKIGRDGEIYYSTINKIVKFTHMGQIEWERSFNPFISPLNINMDGNICFEAEGYLYVLNEKGDIIHKIEINRLTKGFLPLELTDDIFLCEVNRCKLIALDASKNEILWEYQSKGFQVDIYPIIDSANHIIFSTTGSGYGPKSYINIISKDGEGLWEYEIDGSVLSVVLGGDNLLHILCRVPVKKSKNKDELPIGCKVITLRS